MQNWISETYKYMFFGSLPKFLSVHIKKLYVHFLANDHLKPTSDDECVTQFWM